ncbi:PBSX family phage terminase large subunit [Hymenobacter metallilatus]|uniref:PBSX family phage terminase large subunit n=1 Tax=Hymenobacter metallilatus TaxID=2493666 RepID=A0A3R9U6Q2_9BACT|nr:PBSX family phage terminase large subunit [Hymenobacter metallilatus]RSK23959.1 PBSX family phage terminase large subunit [Hymenobacter metallilatus]
MSTAVAQAPEAAPRYVNDAYIPLLENPSRYLVLRGGGGSGKSVWAAQKLAMRLTSEHNHRLLVVRKVKDTLRQSVYEQLLDVLRAWDMLDDVTTTTSPLSIKCRTTNSEILFAGIDDPEKLKSITRITSIWIEEATELELTDFTQLDIRLRGKAQYYKQFIITFNPIDEGHWLKKRFFDTPDPRATVLLTTFQDNYFLPEEDRQTLLQLAAISKNYYRVYVQNEWGKVETGNEFYDQFQRSRHVRCVPYLPGVAILQVWDANAHPYSAMLCAQLQQLPEGRFRVRIFREYTLPAPNSGVRPTARAFLRDWQQHWQSSDVLYTGDASMNNRKPGEGNQTLKKDIESELLPCLTGGSDRWLRQNPNVLRRRDWLNAIFSGYYPDIELWIDESCTETIADLELTQLGIDGKLKEKKVDKEKGITYEVRGHCSDDVDYLFCALFPDKLQQFLRRGLPPTS